MLNKRSIKIKQIRKFLENKNFKFYKIIKIINNYIYQLKLSKSIIEIYLIFYL